MPGGKCPGGKRPGGKRPGGKRPRILYYIYITIILYISIFLLHVKSDSRCPFLFFPFLYFSEIGCMDISKGNGDVVLSLHIKSLEGHSQYQPAAVPPT